MVHNKHLDVYKYNETVGLDDIVVSERNELVDPAAVERKKKQLKRVKEEEEADDGRVSPEPNPGINQLSAFLKNKKQCRS